MIPFTDKELADPDYMRGYCEASNDDFTQLLKAHNKLRKTAKLALKLLEKSCPYNADFVIETLRKELAE